MSLSKIPPSGRNFTVGPPGPQAPPSSEHFSQSPPSPTRLASPWVYRPPQLNAPHLANTFTSAQSPPPRLASPSLFPPPGLNAPYVLYHPVQRMPPHVVARQPPFGPFHVTRGAVEAADGRVANSMSLYSVMLCMTRTNSLF